MSVAALQAAIRARVAGRAAASVQVPAEDVATRSEARIARLAADFGLAPALWEAMWPPSLRPWNLEEDFPIRSHRGALGRALVLAKRVQRALLGLLARPLLVRQAEVNRTLALVVHALADEASREGARADLLEERLLRIGAALRDLRGESESLVVFDDADPEPER